MRTRFLWLSMCVAVATFIGCSSDPTPSTADIKITKSVIDVAKPLGIEVHDHIVVGKEGHASLKGLQLI